MISLVLLVLGAGLLVWPRKRNLTQALTPMSSEWMREHVYREGVER
jgi:hypothetical protein